MNAKTCKELFAALEALAKSAEHNCDIILCYDEEDGFWLSAVERGTTRPHPIYDSKPVARKTLKDAILAAVDWNNSECQKQYSYRRMIDEPTKLNQRFSPNQKIF